MDRIISFPRRPNQAKVAAAQAAAAAVAGADNNKLIRSLTWAGTSITVDGAVSDGPFMLTLSTTASATSSAARQIYWNATYAGDSVYNNRVDSVFEHRFWVSPTNPGSSKALFVFGKSAADANGDLTRKGFGIEVRGNRLWGFVHDGSALSWVDLGVDATSAVVLGIRNTRGVITFRANGVLIGTSPTVISGYIADESAFRAELNNTAAEVCRYDVQTPELLVWM